MNLREPKLNSAVNQEILIQIYLTDMRARAHTRRILILIRQRKIDSKDGGTHDVKAARYIWDTLYGCLSLL